MQVNDCELLQLLSNDVLAGMARNGWKLLENSGFAGIGWEWRGMAGNGWNGLKWLEWLEMAGHGL